MNNPRIPKVRMIDGKGKKVQCNVSNKGIWEAKGYYVEGSKPAPAPAPAPKKTTKKKTTKKWGNDDG